jgi:hypothetical protein
MGTPFKLIATAATAAILIAGATPAMARPGPWGYGGGYGGRGWHHRGGGVSFGDVALGAVIVGGVAAVANGIANGPRTQDRRDDGGHEDGGYDRGTIEDGRTDGHGRIEHRGGDNDGSVDRRGGENRTDDAQEDAVADACADAARAKAGAGSRIDGIRHVGRDGAGWRVEGDVTESRGYGQSFVCGVRDASRVDFVQLSDRVAAR